MASPSSSSAAALPVDQFLKYLSESTLLPAEEVQALQAGLKPSQRQDARLLADELVQQGKLTRYQAHMLMAGKPKGLVLGNYILLDKLGQGGMGMVFKASHKRMKRMVALKVLSPAITKNPNAVQRFQREVEAAAKLSHPHIVAAYDADEAKGVHFLVMEYVEGSDLANLVKKGGTLQVAQVVQCILQAAHGLLHAHQSGIIHRDIKPHNLLLDAKGTVKILDMGLARIEGGNTTGSGGELTQSGSIMGTCDYMAPEQAMNTKNADARADIYSLGCTLYYLLVGKGMYGGETAMEKLMAHQNEPIPALRTVRPDVPKKLETVYQKMVAKKASERYQSLAEVIADLEACKIPATGLAGLSMTMPGVRNQESGVRSQEPPAGAGGETHSSLDDMTQAGDKTQLTPEKKKSKRRRRYIVATVLAFFLAMGIIQVNTDKGTFVIEPDDPEVAVAIDKAGGVVLQDQKNKRTYHLKAGTHRIRSGEYEMTVAELPAGVEFSTTSFTIKKDGEVRVKVSLASGGRQPPGRAASRPGEDHALRFDGKSAHVLVPDWTYKGDHPLTLELWATPKACQTPKSQFLLANIDSAGVALFKNEEGYWAAQNHGTFKYTPAKADKLAEAGRRVHLAAVFDGTDLRLFVQGVPSAAAQMVGKHRVSRLNFLIGAEPKKDESPLGAFDGLIDEVRISRVARYKEQFTPAARFATDQETIALYHFDEGQGDVARDSSGNERHARIVGARWSLNDKPAAQFWKEVDGSKK